VTAVTDSDLVAVDTDNAVHGRPAGRTLRGAGRPGERPEGTLPDLRAFRKPSLDFTCASSSRGVSSLSKGKLSLYFSSPNLHRLGALFSPTFKLRLYRKSNGTTTALRLTT